MKSHYWSILCRSPYLFQICDICKLFCNKIKPLMEFIQGQVFLMSTWGHNETMWTPPKSAHLYMGNQQQICSKLIFLFAIFAFQSWLQHHRSSFRLNVTSKWLTKMSHKLTLNSIHPKQMGNIIILMGWNHKIDWSCLVNHIKRLWYPNIQILYGSQNFLDVMRYNWIDPLSSNDLKLFSTLIFVPFYRILLCNRNNRQRVRRLSKTPEIGLKLSSYFK